MLLNKFTFTGDVGIDPRLLENSSKWRFIRGGAQIEVLRYFGQMTKMSQRVKKRGIRCRTFVYNVTESCWDKSCSPHQCRLLALSFVT